ncbi:MAG: peptidylprolyl isomerase [Myxococcota bacterium]
MPFRVGAPRAFRSLVGLLALVVVVGCSDEGAIADETTPSDPAMRALDEFILASPINRKRSGWKSKLPKPPRVEFEPGKTYYWKLRTNQGEMKVRLFHETAPRHVGTTLYLTRLGFYDGTIFHRVIQGFMAQGGDPKGNGTGGPGFQYEGEFGPNAETHTKRGTLSMANAGPRTDGSQFFLTFRATPNLDGRHTVFGRIEDPESLATLSKIESLGAPRDPGRPSRRITLDRATIVIE